ncbi:MAG: hypothetical protein L0221_05795 [Chloroflexi bacterium]|nr:hypothetical protein [Chloroflexota bacterium]
MRSRSLVISLTIVVLSSLMLAGTAAARAARHVVPMMWHAQTGISGPVGGGARATLVRRDGGVSFSISTSHLRPGHAYTVWFVVVNNPSGCAASPCSGPDILLNPATDSQVTYGAGHVSGASGRAGFAGSFRAGSLDGWLPDAGLHDPTGAQIQLVINDHGLKLKGYLPEQIQTYRAGCTDASLPGIFPASAKSDGTPGPNACQLYQAAVFLSP